MSIELTDEQARAVAAEGEGVVVFDPHTRQSYRLVREEVFQRVRALAYDDSAWTADETARLAATAFGALDDDDYSHYLRDER